MLLTRLMVLLNLPEMNKFRDVHYHILGNHSLEKRSSLTKKTWILFLMIRDGQQI
ncbi:hypothetical protein Dimus_023217, partial [Dionaea muscipula]